MTTATWLERYRTRYLSDDGISFSLGTINLNILALTEVQEWPHRRGMISHHGVSIKSVVVFDQANTCEHSTIPIASLISPAVSCTERY
jgi:hypothetical protein